MNIYRWEGAERRGRAEEVEVKEAEMEERKKKKKQEDRKRRGQTDGRGYAWLKGARREEAIQDLCACKERKHHALTSHMQKSFLRNPLHLNLNSHPLLFTFP